MSIEIFESRNEIPLNRNEVRIADVKYFISIHENPFKPVVDSLEVYLKNQNPYNLISDPEKQGTVIREAAESLISTLDIKTQEDLKNILGIEIQKDIETESILQALSEDIHIVDEENEELGEEEQTSFIRRMTATYLRSLDSKSPDLSREALRLAITAPNRDVRYIATVNIPKYKDDFIVGDSENPCSIWDERDEREQDITSIFTMLRSIAMDEDPKIRDEILLTLWNFAEKAYSKRMLVSYSHQQFIEDFLPVYDSETDSKLTANKLFDLIRYATSIPFVDAESVGDYKDYYESRLSVYLENSSIFDKFYFLSLFHSNGLRETVSVDGINQLDMNELLKAASVLKSNFKILSKQQKEYYLYVLGSLKSRVDRSDRYKIDLLLNVGK